MSIALQTEAYANPTDFTALLPAWVSSDMLNLRINEISTLFMKELRRPLQRAVYTADIPCLVPGKNTQFMRVERFPIEGQISAIWHIIDVPPVTYPINGIAVTDFEQFHDNDMKGLVYRRWRWYMAAPMQDYVTGDSQTSQAWNNYAVQYTGGYVLPNDAPPIGGTPYDQFSNPNGYHDMPMDIRGACINEVLSSLQGQNSGVFGGGQYITEERTPGGWTKKYSDPLLANARRQFPVGRLSDATIDILSRHSPRKWA